MVLISIMIVQMSFGACQLNSEKNKDSRAELKLKRVPMGSLAKFGFTRDYFHYAPIGSQFWVPTPSNFDISVSTNDLFLYRDSFILKIDLIDLNLEKKKLIDSEYFVNTNKTVLLNFLNKNLIVAFIDSYSERKQPKIVLNKYNLSLEFSDKREYSFNNPIGTYIDRVHLDSSSIILQTRQPYYYLINSDTEIFYEGIYYSKSKNNLLFNQTSKLVRLMHEDECILTNNENLLGKENKVVVIDSSIFMISYSRTEKSTTIYNLRGEDQLESALTIHNHFSPYHSIKILENGFAWYSQDTLYYWSAQQNDGSN